MTTAQGQRRAEKTQPEWDGEPAASLAAQRPRDEGIVRTGRIEAGTCCWEVERSTERLNLTPW